MKFATETLTSRQNPTVKWAASLTEGKYRRRERAFLAEGEKLTYEALSAGLPVTHIFAVPERVRWLTGEILPCLSQVHLPQATVIPVSEEVFSRISTENSPQGIVCVIKYLDFFREMDIIYKEDFIFSPGKRLLALESVRDPGNLGAVIRSAVALGTDGIVLSADCADVYHPRTVRAAMGSLFRSGITTVKDFSSFIRAAQGAGRRVLSAELNPRAEVLGAHPLAASDIVIIGNEGHGVSAGVSALCDRAVYIPITDKAESLNAAVAAAIFMWEQNRAGRL